MFNKKMLMIMMMFLIVSYHPSLSVLCLLLMTIYSMFLMKNSMISLSIFLILIIFSTGVLLLLFYLTMISDKNTYWKFSYLSWMLIFIPSFYYLLNYKNSSLSFSLELMNKKLILFLLISMIIIFIVLLLMNLLMSYNKFLRQIF